MDENLYFFKEVIEKYGIDKIITPVNIGDGELANVSLSDLRKELNLCYNDINKDNLKESLLDYIENHTLNLRALLIPQKKDTLKLLNGKRQKLTKEYPNLDYNNENDDAVIEKISNLTWELEQEKYIFYYLKEQKIFLRDWVTQKWVEYKNAEKEKMQLNVKMKSILSKAFIKKENKIIKKPPYFYYQVAVLFIQNYIYRKKSEDELGFDYYYKDIHFSNPSKLSNYIKEEVLKTKYSVKQYIDDTLKENDTPHNFYNFKTEKKQRIIQYCKDNNISIKNNKFLLNPLK